MSKQLLCWCIAWPVAFAAIVRGRELAGASLGIVDVTAAPFKADPTGSVDSTVQLQHAIDAAWKLEFAVFFPSGRYIVSDTLHVNQHNWWPGDAGINIVPNRFRANVLIGSRMALPRARPTIVLRNGSSGFGNPSRPKNVVKITNPEGEAINMNQVFRGIDIDIQEGNPGAIAMYFAGAQGSTVQDVTVRMPSGGFAAFAGGLGAGGSHVNVAAVGGMYGIYFKETQATPLIAGATLINQTRSAVVHGGGDTMVLVGVQILQLPSAEGPAIQSVSKPGDWASSAPLSIIDAVIDCAGINGLSGVGIAAVGSVYAQNTFFRECHTLIKQPAGTHQPILASKLNHGSYSQIHELAQGVDAADWHGTRVTMDVIYVDGRRLPHATLANISVAHEVPSDLVSRHVAWNESAFPSFEFPADSLGGAADAKRDCGAIADGRADDTVALQSCLNKNSAVFLPKGIYRISATLQLNPLNSLVGLSQTLSVIAAASDGFAQRPAGTYHQPLVRTAKGSAAVLAFVGLTTWWHLPDVYTLEWRAKGGLWRNNYETRVCECLWLTNYRTQTTDPPCRPATNLSTAKTHIRGTGSFYNIVHDEDILFTEHTQYRHITVANNSVGPSDRLRLYELNLEHSLSEANAELTGAKHVDIFGIKMEGSTPILWVRDSHDVNLYGLGGPSDALPDASVYPADFAKYQPSLLRIERTDVFRLANLMSEGRGKDGDAPHRIGTWPLTPGKLKAYNWSSSEIQPIIDSFWTRWEGWAVGPSHWHMLLEADGINSTKVLTIPLDRPVLYTRGRMGLGDSHTSLVQREVFV